MTKERSTTWDREDRDLLVELKTNMANVSNDIAAVRAEIKDINTGITSRLLNLESNAVNRIEIKGLTMDIESLKAWRSYLAGAYAVGIIIFGFAFSYYT